MEDIRAFLAENAEKMGICLTDEQTEKFQTYAELLVEWNEKMNLTAIKEPREIAVKHFVDSLTIFSCIQPKKEAKVIDIGSGAGFPGIPMKLYREDLTPDFSGRGKRPFAFGYKTYSCKSRRSGQRFKFAYEI